MNKITILSISAVFVASMIAITAFEAEAKPPSSAICPAENVQHWINFSVGVTNPLIHDTEPDIPDDTTLYVQVSRDGSELYLIEFKQQLIADRLNELGYTQTDGTPVESSDMGGVNTNAGFIGYSTICAEN